MKCKECGAELERGSVICPNCGSEIQIVPDFNIYEDEMFQTVKEEEQKEQEERARQRKKAVIEYRKKRRKKIIIIGVIVAMLAVIVGIVIGINISTSSKNDNSYDYQMQCANEDYANKEYVAALEDLKKALALNGDSLDARFLMAEIYIDEKDYTDAISVLQDILVVDSDNKEAYEQLAKVYDADGDYDAILEMAEKTEDSDIFDVLSPYLVQAPEVNLAGGSYEEIVELHFNYDLNLTLYYTLDGTAPTSKAAILYDGETIEISENTTVRAVCEDEDGHYSLPLEETYYVDYEESLEPEITPDSGTYMETTLITITVPDGAVAYYTTDGSQPTELTTQYTEPFEMPEGNNILSVIVVKGKRISEVFTRNYIYTPMDK